MTENEISYTIRGAIYNVYNELGPGLLESIYESTLFYELINVGMIVQRQIHQPVYYKNNKLDVAFRLDLLIENKVIIEIKSVEYLREVHHKQTLSYLKMSKLKLAIQVNFNVDEINNGIFRKVNKL